MFRSLRHLKVYKCMCSSATTCCQNCVIGILPAKNHFYRYFLIYSVILRSGQTSQYIFLLIFVLWFHWNTTRSLLPALSYITMPSNLVEQCTRYKNVCYGTVRIYRDAWVRIQVYRSDSPHFESFSAYNTCIQFILKYFSL